MKRKLVVQLFIIFVITGFIRCDPDPAPTLPPPWNHEGTQIDDELQDFVLTDSDGNTVQASQFRGQVILLVFFSPWADECREEARWLGCQAGNPSYGCYLALHKDLGLTVLTVLIDDDDGNIPSLEYARQWKHDYGITDPVLVDTSDREVYNTFTDSDPTDGLQDSDSYYVPLTLVVDRNFVVFSRFTEFLQEDMESDLDRLY
jgi:peroxiredoxin